VSRHVSGLSLWLVFACLPAGAVSAAPAALPVAITFADQPVKLARDTGMYSAGRGAALLPNDLIVSGAGTILLDAGGTTVALGPDSAMFIKNGELVLLKGWLKVNCSATRALLLTTASLQFDSAGIAATLHATPGRTDVFAESGTLAVLELPAGKTPHRASVPREQFGVRSGALPLKLSPRPPAAFLSAMPRTFLDTLVPLAAKGPPVPAKRERSATWAELAPLVAEQPALRQQLQLRFAPPHQVRPMARPAPSPNQLF
jgi:hypothetical protein